MGSKKVVISMVASLLLLATNAPAQSSFRFSPVVHAGDEAPVPSQLGSILEFSTNPQGQTAVLGDGGIFIRSDNNTTVVAAPGDASPSGGIFDNVDGPLINSQGQVAFRGNASFPNPSGLFLFSKGAITLAIPDGTLASNGVAVTPSAMAVNAAGDMVINNNSNALFLFSNGSLTPLVAAGQAAPGGGTFSLFFAASINSADQVAFEGFLSTGGTGIFLISGGTITKIVAQGDVFPDGGVFAFPTAPAINDSGQITFGGVSSGSIADSGLFLFTNGQLTVPVPVLTVLPDGTFLNDVITVSMNNAGQIAFVGFTIGGPISTPAFLLSGGQLSEMGAPGQTAPDGNTFINSVEVGANIDASGRVVFLGAETQRGNALYRFTQGQLARVIGQGDNIPRDARFEFPIGTGIGKHDRMLISDSTFPGGAGLFTAGPSHHARLVDHIGESTGADGVVDLFFGSAMNREHQVAISVATPDNSDPLLLESRGQFTILGDRSSPVDPRLGTPAIDNAGEVAFSAFVPATGQQGLFLNSAGQITLLVDAATPLPTGGTLTTTEDPALNNQHQVAFVSEFSFPSPNAIYLSFAGQITPLARDGDSAPGGGNFSIPFADPRFGPVINDNGQVAFATFLNNTTGGFFGSGGVFLFNQGALTRIVGPGDSSPDGGVFLFADAPTINAQGDVAFFGETSAFSFGAFLFSKGTIVQVAIAGDMAGKEPLAFVDMPQVNDNGHVGFTATLNDSTNAIFVAVPKDPDQPDPAAAAAIPAAASIVPFSTDQTKAFRDKNASMLARRQHRDRTNQQQTPLQPRPVAR